MPACSAVAGLAALWLGRGGRAAVTQRRSRRPIGARSRSPRRRGAPAPTADRPVRQFRPDPRLALTVAFISGLTSLGYQVTWTRLLASGTGNTTYVFTTILATFLIGIALGAVLFAVLRTRLGDPVRLLAASQVIAAALAIAGLVFVLVQPARPDPGQADRDPPGVARDVALRRPARDHRTRDRVPGVIRAARG